MPNVQHKRGTRAALNILAAGSGLLPGQVYIITDEGRIAIATSAAAYQAMAKQSEVQDTRGIVLQTDFTTVSSAQNDFSLAIIGTGASFTAVPAAARLGPNHPGVQLWRSGTTANSGVQCSTATGLFRIGGGEQWDVNFATPAAYTGTTFRTGAQDSLTVTAPIDGIYLEFSGSGAIIGKCRNNNAETATVTLATLATSTDYHGRISVNAAATLVTFSLYDDASILLGQQTAATNIPVVAGRELGWASVATNSGTVAADMIHMDRQMLTNPGRNLLRGAA